MAKINWIEIPTTDLERASRFYNKVFSARITEASTGEDAHYVIQLSGEVGGILYKVDEVKNGITVYFHVDRMTEALDKVNIYGGEVLLGKTLIKAYNQEENVISKTYFDGKTGYYAKIKDSEGNILGIHSNA